MSYVDPDGVRLLDGLGRKLLLVCQPGHPYDGWLMYESPACGGWVTLRKAGDDDMERIRALTPFYTAGSPTPPAPSETNQ